MIAHPSRALSTLPFRVDADLFRTRLLDIAMAKGG